MSSTLGSALVAALLLLPGASAVDFVPVDVPNGPNKLDECTACPGLYRVVVRCQQIDSSGGKGEDIVDCICDNTWKGFYPFREACHRCMASSGDDIFNNLDKVMDGIYDACMHSNEDSIKSDGLSICAEDLKYDYCVSLKDASDGDSWASIRELTNSDDAYFNNKTQSLNLAALDQTPICSSTASAAAKKSATTHLAASEDPASTAQLSYGSLKIYVLGVSIFAGIGLLA
ncbi:hypothetical protein VTI28DRAFT_1849 [Corynascus sepedonium]